MAITISGANNVDKILATDGVLDSISGFNVVGVMTAGTFDVTGKTTTGHLNVGSNIQLGNAGIITATTLIGNVTGNVNATSNLLLQIGGSEKFRVGGSGQLGIGGANYGTSGQVLSSGGSGSAATWSTISSPAISAIASDGASRVVTSDGDGTATAHSEVKIETVSGNKRLSINKGSGSTEVPLLVRRTDASGIVAEFSNSGGYGVYIGQNGATGEGYIRTATGQPLVFTTNSGSGLANERLRITSDGNVTIGNSSVAFPSGIGLQIYNSSVARLKLATNATGVGANDGFQIYMSNSGAILENKENAEMRFYTNATERMRILNDGDVVVGSYAAEYYESFTISPNHDNGAPRITFSRAPSSAVSIVIAFKNAGGQIGRIEHDHTSCGIFSSSDYRLKENALSISDGIARLKTLKPYRFNFIADATKTVDGFFAHEVTAVPEAVSGEKDAVDEDGNPDYQVIDHSKLVPLLTAALQEAITKIETLETKVAALEGS